MSVSAASDRANQVEIDYTQVEANNFDGDNGSDPANPEGYPSLVTMNDGENYAYTLHARNQVNAGAGSQWSFLLTNASPELDLTIDSIRLYTSSEQGPWRGTLHFGERLVAGNTADGFPRDFLGRMGFTVGASSETDKLREHYLYDFPDGWHWTVNDNIGFMLANGNGSATADDCVHEITLLGRIGPETNQGRL